MAALASPACPNRLNSAQLRGRRHRGPRASRKAVGEVFLRQHRLATCSTASPACRNTIRPAPSLDSCEQTRRDGGVAPEAGADRVRQRLQPQGAVLLDAAPHPRRLCAGRHLGRVPAKTRATLRRHSHSRGPAGRRGFLPAVRACRAIAALPRAGFFPGSTIGNFEPYEAARSCASWRHSRQGAVFLVGVDLVKDPRSCTPPTTMPRASRRVQPQSPRAHQPRARRQFDLDDVRAPCLLQPRARAHRDAPRQHAAAEGEGRRRKVEFRAGETIHTENSYKYTVEFFGALARGSGWTPVAAWTDPLNYFSVHALLFNPDGARSLISHA